jgi:von Willebrand factor type A C-terminal domain
LRQYHVSIRVPAKAIGDEMLAARVGVVVDRHSVEEALVKAIWTDDPQRSTPINRDLAHYTGQAHLAEAIQDGLNAHKAGDEPTATLKLGRAVQLAAESNNHDTMKLLLAVLDIDDAATGSVRLKRNVAQEDEMTLDTRSTKTVGVSENPILTHLPRAQPYASHNCHNTPSMRESVAPDRGSLK